MPEEEKKQPSKAELDMQAYQDSYKANTPQVTQGTQQTPPTQQTPATQETQRTPGMYEASATRVTAPVINKIDTTELENNLAEQNRLAIQQSDARIDRATQQGEQELRDQWENAQEGYRTQQNQISRDEAQAKDNSALYSEMKGDRGGIGRAQYDAIQNNAATNRLNVQRDQQKMAADIQKQITQLRANGEFQKADALLSMTQSYLAQLQQLWQWSIQTNLSVEEMNAQMQQWEDQFNENAKQFGIQMDWQASRAARADYEADRAYDRNVFESDRAYDRGVYEFEKNYGLNYWATQLNQDKFDYQKDQDKITNDLNERTVALNENKFKHDSYIENATLALNTQTRLASEGNNRLQSGLMPTPAQLEAMGLTEEEAKALMNGSGNETVEITGTGPNGYKSGSAAKDLFAMAAYQPNSTDYLKKHAAEYGIEYTAELAKDFDKWREDGGLETYQHYQKLAGKDRFDSPGGTTPSITNKMSGGRIEVGGKSYTNQELSAAVANGSIIERRERDAKGNTVITYVLNSGTAGGSRANTYTALK